MFKVKSRQYNTKHTRVLAQFAKLADAQRFLNKYRVVLAKNHNVNVRGNKLIVNGSTIEEIYISK